MTRNNLSLFIALFSLVQIARAQDPAKTADATVTKPSKFYIKLYGGYGLITPGSDRITALTAPNGGPQQFTVGKKGLGAGLHYGGGVGFIANDFLNLGLDADYLKGTKLTSTDFVNGGPNDYFSNSHSIEYSVLSIIPNVTFKALSKPNYFIYTRIGIILTAKVKYTMHETDSATYPQTTSARVTEKSINDYSFKLNAGAQLALGVQFTLTGKLRGFAEIVGNYLPVSPSSSITNGEQYTYNSNNQLEGGTKSTPVTTTYSNSGINTNSTTTAVSPSVVFNINSIGISAGIAYKF